MKQSVWLSITAIALLIPVACTSMNNQEDMQVRAAAKCINLETEDARKTCMDTELAAMTALEREEQQEYKDAQLDRERREALRQAYGVPKSAARESYDNGLGVPGGRSK